MISVLFIDDDAVQLEIARHFLEQTGDFTVDILGLAKRALASEKLLQYDAIVSDYQMPGMDGIELLRTIRASGNPVPFLLFTGKGREEIAIQALDEGADFYVMKGGEPEAQYRELAHKIRIAVQRQRDKRQIEDNDRALHALFRSMVGSTGMDSLKTIAGSICAWLGVDCVMVGEIQPDGNSVKVHAMNLDGRDVEGFSYSLRDTPCNDVTKRGFCIYPDHVRGLFPFAKDLAVLDIRGYAGTPLRDPAGRITGVLCILSRTPLNTGQVTREMVDIFAAKASAEIARKRAEEALYASEEKYRILTDAAEDFIFVIDDDCRFLHMNRFGIAKLRRESADVIGRTLAEIFPPDIAHRQVTLIRQVFSTGQPARTEATIPVPGGEVWVDVQLVPVRSADGSIVAVLGISRDITDRRQIELALRENLERHRLILEKAHEGIMINELTPRGPGKFIECNEAASRISGLSLGELREVSLLDLDTPGMNERAPSIMQDLMRNHHTTFQTPYVTRDRLEKTIEISTSLFELSGRTTMLSIVRDITEQKRADEALRHANKRLNLMTGITRHDIRNQLLSLNAYLLLSKETPGIPKKLAEFIEKEEAIAKTIERQILFTREYEDLGVSAPAWQNAGQAIAAAVRGLDLTGVTLESLTMSCVEIFSDPLLQKAFLNLADNSLRHGGDTLTAISLSFHETADGLVIVYEDDGAGIPAEEKEVIFDRGYGRNSGFGLFFIREILAITGITIRECGEPGKGARFEIAVPKDGYRIIRENG